MRVTRANIAKAIKEETGDVVEVIQGNGYVYFWNDDIAGWESSSVPVPRVGSMTIPNWVDYYKHLKNGETK